HLVGGSSVGESATLAEHSVLAAGQEASAGQTVGGSPAQPVSAVSPMLAQIRAQSAPAGESMTPGLSLLLLVGAVTLEALPFLAIVPAVALVWWALLSFGLLAGLAAAVVAGPVYVLSVCVVLALARVVVVDETRQGVHPAISRLGLQRWYVDKVFELSLFLTNSLYATLYTPHWLRLLGAKIGRNSEVSTLAHVDPELLVISDEGFVADMAHVGSAVVHNGYIATATTTVGCRSFVGNASFIPAGNNLGDGSLVGVHTVPPSGSVPADTSWLGSPAIHLPRRQESKSFADDLIYNPPRRRVIERLVIEFMRITAPASLLGVMVYLALQAISEISQGQPYWVVLPLAPLVLLGGSVGVVLVVAALKWALIGDYTERVEPLWGRFVRWSELVTGVYEAAAVPALLNVLRGTPMLPVMLRLFGARIGPRAYVDTTYLTEFDLVEIGPDAVVGAEVSLQTHLFEDRVMKMSTVWLKEGSSIGERSVVLYDASVGVGADLGPLSLVMKGEDLPDNTRWLGIPAALHA
ncbi:MAG: Pls/PosA family non-ribosomal peptide synthetase, partial [Microbacteriaceae bacterium]